MSYDILTIRTTEHDNGALFPVMGDDRFPIGLEGLDGEDVRVVTASALSVSELRGGALHPVARVADVRADLVITDARIAVACARYDRGGGWVGLGGGPLLPAGLDAMNRTGSRRKGRMLVGHTRYAWLRSVGCESKTGPASAEAIRIGVVSELDGPERHLYLTCTLSRDVSAVGVGREIARRAARYRLRHTAVDSDEVRTRLEELAAAAPSSPAPEQSASYNFPTYFPVSPDSAYPAGRDLECGS